MVVVPLSQSTKKSDAVAEATDWVGVAAGGTLLAGALLLLMGYRRTGTAVAASGAALALLNQQETVKSWWNELPRQIDEFQNLLGHVQGTIEDLEIQRERLRQIIAG